jgi:predicted RNA-binding protein YlqC (UPF0109 family)
MFHKIAAFFRREDSYARGIAEGAFDRLLETEKSVEARIQELEKRVEVDLAALKSDLAKAGKAISALKSALKRTKAPVKKVASNK